jgi:hypothetical protein
MRQSEMQADENLLIVVDQFEELFRFEETFECDNPADEAAAFVKLLLEATIKQRELDIYVVLTMRSDYLGESARFGGLPKLSMRANTWFRGWMMTNVEKLLPHQWQWAVHKSKNPWSIGFSMMWAMIRLNYRCCNMP